MANLLIHAPIGRTLDPDAPVESVEITQKSMLFLKKALQNAVEFCYDRFILSL